MFRKIFIYCAALIALVGSGSLVHAQTNTVQAEDAQVYVTDISLATTTVAAGSTVQGTFVLSNPQKNVNVPDIMYEISLVGEYQDNGLPGVYYDTKVFGPVFLKTGEQNKLVAFSYPLPAAFGGDNLGIHVRAVLKSGAPLGFSETPIKVTGAAGSASVTDVVVVIGDKRYGSQAGPMLYENQKGTVQAHVLNTTKSSITLTPHIIIHDRSKNGPSLVTYNETAISLDAGKDQSISYALPTFNNKAGVYLGELTMLDQSGAVKAPTVYFRYIVAGDIITITGITSTTPTAQKGAPIDMVINFAGSPYDIDTGEVPGLGKADLNVTVKNEHDVVVGTYKEAIDFNVLTSKNVRIQSTGDAKALKAEVTATRDGKELARYTTELSPNYKEAQAAASHTIIPGAAGNNVWYVIGAVLLVLLLIVILIVVRKRMVGRKMMVFVLGLLVTGIVVGFTQNNTVLSFTQTNEQNIKRVWNYVDSNPSPTTVPLRRGYHPFSSNEPWLQSLINHEGESFVPHLSLNSPSNNQSMKPGQSFRVTGTTYADACNNAPQDLIISITFQGVTKTQTFSNINNNKNNFNHDFATSQHQDFSIGPFTAPVGAGEYNITIKVTNNANLPDKDKNAAARAKSSLKATPTYWDAMGGELTGYQTIVVSSPKPVVQLHANPSTVAYNASSTLTWSSQNATECTSTDFSTGTNKLANNSVGVSTGNLTTGKTYSITCKGPGGIGTDDVPVTVENAPAPLPTVTLTASPATVNSGENSNLTWTSQNATSCTASEGWSGAKAVSGSQSTGPLTQGTVFKIICTGPGGSTPATATVNINAQLPLPTVNLTASPNPVPYGTGPVLTWTSQNATTCAGTNFSTGYGGAYNGSATTNPQTTAMTYTINCTGPGGAATSSVTVAVVQNPSPTVTLTSNKSEVIKGESATLTWASTNATTCTASQGWSGTKTLNGSQSTGPLTQATVYRITCTSAQGGTSEASASVTIYVRDPQITATCRAYDANNNPITSIKSNTTVVWKATPISGATYQWDGTAASRAASPDPTFTTQYTTTGPKEMAVTITIPGDTTKTIECQPSLSIKSSPTFIEY